MSQLIQFFRAAIMIMLLLSSIAVAQAKHPEGVEKIVTIKKNASALGEVLSTLGEGSGLSFGLELSSLDFDHEDYDLSTYREEAEPTMTTETQRMSGSAIEVSVAARRSFSARTHTISLEFENVPISQVLDSIVAQMKNYSWQMDEGVINFIPTKGRFLLFRDLLNIEVNRFEMEPNPRGLEFRKQIASLPEVKAFLDANDLEISLNRSGLVKPLMRRYDGQFSYRSIKLRELLNRIVQAKGGGWILRESSFRISNRRTIELDL